MATRFQGVHGRPPAGPGMAAANAALPHRVLSAAQQARRKKRQAEGINLSDGIDPAERAKLDADPSLLPTHVLMVLQRKREQRQSNTQAAGATDLTGAVPPGTPHAVQQANALQQGPKALDPATLAYHRRRRKGGPAGGKPGMGQYPLRSA